MKRFLIIFAALLGFIFLSACQLEPDPQVAVQEGMNALIDAKKSVFEISAKGASEGENGVIDFDVNFQGKSDSKDPKKVKMDMMVDGTIKAAEETTKAGFDLRIVGKTSLLRLNTLELPGTESSEEALGQFLNKWWELPADENKNGFFQNLTVEQEQFIQVIKENLLFTNIRSVGEETVKDISNRKYQVDINKESLQKILEALPTLTGEEPVEDADKAALAARLQEVEFSGNVWVGKDDEAVHRIAGTLRVTPKEGGVVSTDLDMLFWDFGKEVVVEKPEDVTPFSPALLLGLVGSLIPTPPAPAPEAPNPNEPIDQPLGAKQAK